MLVLIADDDRGTRTLLARTLERWKLDVVQVSDGRAAWDALNGSVRPSLAILDWMMPGVDGPEICRRIRSVPALAAMHVILLTSRDGHADIVAGLEAGADDYVVKPFNIDELRARVHVGIRIATLQQRLAAQVEELQAARDELTRLATIDGLTELLVRRRWTELADTEFGRFRRYRRPFAVLMADLDFFKRVNDTFGHVAGDKVLKQFAEVLRSACRGLDAIGRVGGEEFAVLLPETTLAAAMTVGQRIVDECRSMRVPVPHGKLRVTCSVGLAEPVAGDTELDAVMRRADGALYTAKRRGRDRVEAEGEPPAAALAG